MKNVNLTSRWSDATNIIVNWDNVTHVSVCTDSIDKSRTYVEVNFVGGKAVSINESLSEILQKLNEH